MEGREWRTALAGLGAAAAAAACCVRCRFGPLLGVAKLTRPWATVFLQSTHCAERAVMGGRGGRGG